MIPGTPLKLHDVSIPRRPIHIGSMVTGEDPAGSLYGGRYRVIGIEDGRAILHGCRAEYTRAEIRDVRDKPISAQIGWPKTVWDRAGYRVVRLLDKHECVSNCGRHRTLLKRGEVLKNVNLSTQPNHVITNYNVHDEAVMLMLSFDADDVTRGSLEDAEVEVTVKQAFLADWLVL